MIGLEYGAVVCWMLPRPSAGKSTRGDSAVTGIGTDSQIQSTAMKRATPAVRQPSTLSPSGGGRSRVTSSAPGPRTQPDQWRNP